ncbi:hypothetical protein NOM07_15230 [Proteus terrae]|uniref:hypothetical protein n=1 Tax=Proteus terrae TaxID=1574161 RepID=UPI00217DC273|nr:hypothetical protein [Proteus terrae]MCS6714166.1 hypothetical protein [Proteus terrae]MCS6733723.1 hypothetical protein [Proteus terrae]
MLFKTTPSISVEVNQNSMVINLSGFSAEDTIKIIQALVSEQVKHPLLPPHS